MDGECTTSCSSRARRSSPTISPTPSFSPPRRRVSYRSVRQVVAGSPSMALVPRRRSRRRCPAGRRPAPTPAPLGVADSAATVAVASEQVAPGLGATEHHAGHHDDRGHGEDHQRRCRASCGRGRRTCGGPPGGVCGSEGRSALVDRRERSEAVPAPSRRCRECSSRPAALQVGPQVVDRLVALCRGRGRAPAAQPPRGSSGMPARTWRGRSGSRCRRASAVAASVAASNGGRPQSSS